MKRRTFRVEAAHTGHLLGEALAAELGVSREEAERLVAVGAVYVAGRRSRDAKAKLSSGQVVTAVLEEGGQSPLAAAPLAAPELRVLHEDADVLAVDKPAGMTA